MTSRKNLHAARRNHNKTIAAAYRARLVIIIVTKIKIIARRLMTNGNVFIMMRDRRRRFTERMHILL